MSPVSEGDVRGIFPGRKIEWWQSRKETLQMNLVLEPLTINLSWGTSSLYLSFCRKKVVKQTCLQIQLSSDSKKWGIPRIEYSECHLPIPRDQVTITILGKSWRNVCFEWYAHNSPNKCHAVSDLVLTAAYGLSRHFVSCTRLICSVYTAHSWLFYSPRKFSNSDSNLKPKTDWGVGLWK